MPLSGQLEREEKERATVRQSISRLQHEMRRLSTLISEKSGEQYRLEQDNVLMQNDFVNALKVNVLYIGILHSCVHVRLFPIHVCTCFSKEHVYTVCFNIVYVP